MPVFDKGPPRVSTSLETYLSRGSIQVVFLLLWSMKYSFPSKSLANSHPSGKGISPFLLLGIFHWLNPFKRTTEYTRELASYTAMLNTSLWGVTSHELDQWRQRASAMECGAYAGLTNTTRLPCLLRNSLHRLTSLLDTTAPSGSAD